MRDVHDPRRYKINKWQKKKNIRGRTKAPKEELMKKIYVDGVFCANCKKWHSM